MSGKVEEIERQLVGLQMELKTQNDIISVYEKNMAEEISVATYRVQSDFEGVSKHLETDQGQSTMGAKKQIGLANKTIFVPAFQKIDILYVEAINKLESIREEYQTAKSDIYNVSNISAWTPFDSSINQLNKENEDYKGRSSCIENFWNVDLDSLFDFHMPINHC